MSLEICIIDVILEKTWKNMRYMKVREWPETCEIRWWL